MAGNSENASEAVAPQTVFDLDGTLRRLGGDETLLADLVQLYDEDSPELISRLIEGVDNHRGDDVRHAAHSLRGLAANFGAAALSEPLLHLEEAAIQGRMDEAETLLNQVRRESARLQQSLTPHHR